MKKIKYAVSALTVMALLTTQQTITPKFDAREVNPSMFTVAQKIPKETSEIEQGDVVPGEVMPKESNIHYAESVETADPSDVVYVPDPVLSDRIHKSLGMSEAELLTVADMQRIEFLVILDPVLDLEGLQYATNMTSLIYDGTTDIDPITDLTNLETLWIDVNYETGVEDGVPVYDWNQQFEFDFAQLENLTNLESFKIDGTGFLQMLDHQLAENPSDMYEVAEKTFDSQVKLHNIDEITKLQKLTTLVIYGTDLNDISPLADTNLVDVILLSNRISDYRPLGAIDELDKTQLTYGNDLYKFEPKIIDTEQEFIPDTDIVYGPYGEVYEYELRNDTDLGESIVTNPDYNQNYSSDSSEIYTPLGFQQPIYGTVPSLSVNDNFNIPELAKGQSPDMNVIAEGFAVQATDDKGNDITSSVTIDDSTVDWNTPGSYTLTFDVEDSVGFKNSATSTITIDDVLPELTIANKQIETNVGQEITDYKSVLDVNATEFTSGDLNDAIVIDSSAVDYEKVGEYPVTVSVSDDEGNVVSDTATVTVIDTDADDDGLTDDEEIELGTDPNNADTDGDGMTDKDEVDGGYNPLDPTDYADTVKPIISGVSNKTITVGDKFDPMAGVSAKDDRDGNITNKIKVSGTVNTSKTGTYSLTYLVSDKAGNETSAKRIITVKAKESTTCKWSGTADSKHNGTKFCNTNGKHVKSETWKSGHLVMKGNYDKYGKLDTRWSYDARGNKTKYEDWNSGHRVQINTYKSNKVYGKFFYDNKGVTTKYQRWTGGKRIQQNMYRDGKVYTKFFYNSNRQLTKYEKWSKGTKVQANTYKRGKVYGKFYYNSKGLPTKYQRWDRGHVIQTNTYKNGHVNGKYFYNSKGEKTKYEQWSNGNRTLISTYKHNKVSKKTYYNTKGQITRIEEWNNGHKMEVSTYSNGKLTKKTYYNTNGKVTKVVTYKNGHKTSVKNY